MTRYKKQICIISITIFVSFLISQYLFQFMIIQGESMAPTYHSWQFSLIYKQAKEYCVGDVVVFRCPDLDAMLVKRIVAVEGDEIRVEDGKLIVNDKETDFYPIQYKGVLEQTHVVEHNGYFVLGDNLTQSKDSRYEMIGDVKKEMIIGKVIPQKVKK